jgi:hypothetical protein
LPPMSTSPILAEAPPEARPKIGDRYGAVYVVVESTPERLRYRTRDGLLLLMIPISALALAWNALYWLFIFFLPGWMGRGLRSWGLTAPVFGIVLVAWLGRSFEFDGRAGSFSRRRFYFFIRTWSAADLEAVVVRVDSNATPGGSDPVDASVALRSGEAVEILPTEFVDAAGWNRLAPIVSHAAALLRIPLRITGEPRFASEETRRGLETRSTSAAR